MRTVVRRTRFGPHMIALSDVHMSNVPHAEIVPVVHPDFFRPISCSIKNAQAGVLAEDDFCHS